MTIKRGTGRRIILRAALLLACANLDAAPAQTGSPGTTEPWVAPDRAARKENPVSADAASLAKGKELFVMGCVPCHGATGKGDGSAAAGLERNGVRIHPGNLSDPKMWQQTDGAIFWKISEGKSPMPSWQTLTEEQRWLIVNYVRTLAPKPEGNPATTNKVVATKSEGKL